ncbi:probable methyltransferase PMT27 [Lactuca sativa]|uniref:probable methyltransferase PMT27 n=1 Tax=Lactuca sativa TaxID=4236 RepID=UPI000CD88D10|nr:probable methyltransferase PMT27 [Lactuca sativa]
MAIGKPRANKRSSGISCSSAVTMAVLVTVCVLGVWMLTSSSAVYPSTTTQINNLRDDTLSDIKRRFVKFHRKIPDDASKDKLLDHTTNASVSEDNHSDFLMDVMKNEDESKSHNDLENIQEKGKDYKLQVDESSGEVRFSNIEVEPKQESMGNDVDDDAESLNDSDAGKQEAEQLQEEAIEKQEMEISTTVVKDSLNGMEGEASAEEEQKQITQKIKENTMTRGDQDTGNEYDQQSDMGNQDDKQTEPGGEDDTQELEDNKEQESVNEGKEKSMQNQEEKEEQEEDKEGESQQGRSSQIPHESETQVDQQEDQKERQEEDTNGTSETSKVADNIDMYGYQWKLCNVKAGTNYIPCLDNEIAIRNFHHWQHNEHHERHCPKETPDCLVPLPRDYKTPIPWPQSRDKIWLHNVPSQALSDLKGRPNSVKVTGEIITFPSAETRFTHGAGHYIDFLEEAAPEIAWGKHTRVILDVGCGIANFGGYLFDKDVLAMSFAPRDDHEAQIQFALERGIPAISAIMGSQRLPFPSNVFDLVHCAHCRVPWHKEGGILLLEVNRMLRPGGYFVWSATPVYRTHEEDIQIWKEMSALTVAMCWKLVTIKKDKLNAISVAVYHKPDSNECYHLRKTQQPPMCELNDDPDAAWYEPLHACMHEVPMGETYRGSHWPEEWPDRVQKPPYWLNKSQIAISGKPTANDFIADYEHWKQVISKSYMSKLGINWSSLRNVMDMRATYGGFAAAVKDLNLWVLNVVNIDSPDTLPLIFERGLFGIYHDWCESFSTYPRTYDLLHADYLFSNLKSRCNIKSVMAEVDRILRPGGNLIARDESSMIMEIEKVLKSLHWEVNSTFTNKQEGIISGRKSIWRPSIYTAPFLFE